jgi:hypothetical protein
MMISQEDVNRIDLNDSGYLQMHEEQHEADI